MEPAFLKGPLPLGGRLLGLLFQSSCLECGQRVEASALGGLCLACWKRLPWISGPLKGAHVAARFEGSWREAIHAYKFKGRLSFRRPFASLLQGMASPLSFDALLGVPASKSALKERGYDHVAAFAKPLASKLGKPYLDKALQRSREGAKEARLKREQRFANAAGAYQAALGKGFQGSSLLPVDDVMTTGATLQACAVALREAGAGKVEFLVLAAGI